MNNYSKLIAFFTNVKMLTFTLVILLTIGLFTTSCKNDEDIVELEDSTVLDTKTFETQTVLEKANDGVNTIVEDFFYFEEIFDSRNPSDRFLPDCVTITRVFTQNSKIVTVDFGNGCELRNGNFVSGKIVIEYNRIPNELTKTIEISFIDFYFNNKNITGHKTLTRIKQNNNENPQSTYSTNITVTWPDGSFASSQGQRTREWIEGVGSGFWGDNVYSITGNWTFIKKNGAILIGTITTPLRRELSCRFLVSGTVELNKNGNVATLDYGNGICDAIGTITINGEEHIIHVRH